MLINPTTVTLIESEHDNWKNRPIPHFPSSDSKQKLLFELRETFISCPAKNNTTKLEYDGKIYLMEQKAIPALSTEKWKEVTAICLSWKSTLYDFKDKSPENEYEAKIIRHCDELLNKESKSLGIQRFQNMVESDSQLTHDLRLGIAVLSVLGLRLVICEQKEFQWSTFNTLQKIEMELSPEEKSSAPIFIWKEQEDCYGLVNQGVFIPHQSEFEQHRVVVPQEIVLEIKQKELNKEAEQQKKKKTQSPPPVLPRIIREEKKKKIEVDVVPEPLFSADIPDTESDSEEEEEKNPVDCLFCDRAGENCSRELSGCERCRARRIGCRYRKATTTTTTPRRSRNNNKKEPVAAVVATRACVTCSKAKVACSMTLPACLRCERKNAGCVYSVGKAAEKAAVKANMDLILLAASVKAEEEEEKQKKKKPKVVLKHKGNHYKEDLNCPSKDGYILVSDTEEIEELKDPEPKDPEPPRKKRTRSQEDKEQEPAEKKQQIIEQPEQEQELEESESEPEQAEEEEPENAAVVVAAEPILRTDNGDLNRKLLDVFAVSEEEEEEQVDEVIAASAADVAMEQLTEPAEVEPKEVEEQKAAEVEPEQIAVVAADVAMEYVVVEQEVIADVVAAEVEENDVAMEPVVEQQQEEELAAIEPEQVVVVAEVEPEVIADVVMEEEEKIAVFRPITPPTVPAGRFNDMPTILSSAPQTPRTGQQQPTASPIPYDLISTWDQMSVAQETFPDNLSLSEGFMFLSQDKAETKDLSQEFQPMADLPPQPAQPAAREFKLDGVLLNFHVPGFLSPQAVFHWNQITSKLNLFMLKVPENSDRGTVFNRVVHGLTNLSNATPNFELQLAAFASAMMDDQLFTETVSFIIRCV